MQNFAIVIDEEKYGELEILKPETKLKRTRVANRWAAVAPIIKARVLEMKPGEVVEFKLPDGERIELFQSRVSTQASNLLGKGGEYYVTAQRADKSGVEVLKLQ